jgi:hypothetical protein
MQGDKNIRLGKELLNKLEKIQKLEEERGNTNLSYKKAGEILSKRIDDAGGLKEV